jgi:peptide/nickel transport system permease protein
MIRYIIRRFVWLIPTMLLITFVVFYAVRKGSDPVASYLRLNPRASQAKIQQYKDANGLNGSVFDQYRSWLWKFVRFDWGKSIKGNRPVWPSMKEALANSAVLGFVAASVGIGIGMIVGIIAALRPRSLFDSTATTGSFVGLSLPPFVSAVLLQLLFSVYMGRWLHMSHPFLPTSGVYPPGHHGFDLVLRAKHLVLPVTVVAIQTIAVYSRYMRASLMEVTSSDYLRTARAKGISERRVIIRHALRNALIPIVTVAAIDIGAIIGGLIITERIFEYKGMGDFFLTAYNNGDFPQLMPWLVFVIIGVILFNLIADILYAFLDPRIRLD